MSKYYPLDAERRDEQAVQRAIKVKEATREKDFQPYPEQDTDMADPAIFDEEIIEELGTNDYYGKPQEEYTKIRVKKLEQHLEKYANPFPIEVFPKPIRLHILDAEKCFNFPKEFYAAGILSAVAGAIRNNFQLLFKDGIVNVATLYLMIVGRPGLNKSSPLERALKPLLNKEMEYEQEYKRQYAIFKKNQQDGDKDAVEPICGRCLINDSTMEATLELLAENPLGLTLYYDEFMGFLKSMNKYRGGDDLQKWISIWSGKGIWIDRKGKKKKFIKIPIVVTVGTIQTDVVIKFIFGFKENNGFIDRLLYAISASNKPAVWNNEKPNLELEAEYHRIVKNITDIDLPCNDLGELNSRMVHLTPNAFNRILSWQNENAKMSEEIDDPQIAGIYKKLEIYALRFTLIMAVMDYAYKRPAILASDKIKIFATEQHVDAAIKITEYFRGTAKRIMEFVSKKIPIKHYDNKFIKFLDALPPQFNTQQALMTGKRQNLSERTVYNYLKFDMIKNTDRGQYEKRYRRE